MDKDLLEFVEHARSKCFDPAAICRMLVVSGWRDTCSAEAVCAREIEVVFPTPDFPSAVRPSDTRRAESPWPRRAWLARCERIDLRGPETGQRYEYTVTRPTTHVLDEAIAHGRSPDARVLWNHPSGRQCCGINSRGPTCPPHRGAHE